MLKASTGSSINSTNAATTKYAKRKWITEASATHRNHLHGAESLTRARMTMTTAGDVEEVTDIATNMTTVVNQRTTR